jgi:hypothetical protein
VSYDRTSREKRDADAEIAALKSRLAQAERVIAASVKRDEHLNCLMNDAPCAELDVADREYENALAAWNKGPK